MESEPRSRIAKIVFREGTKKPENVKQIPASKFINLLLKADKQYLRI